MPEMYYHYYEKFAWHVFSFLQFFALPIHFIVCNVAYLQGIYFYFFYKLTIFKCAFEYLKTIECQFHVNKPCLHWKNVSFLIKTSNENENEMWSGSKKMHLTNPQSEWVCEKSIWFNRARMRISGGFWSIVCDFIRTANKFACCPRIAEISKEIQRNFFCWRIFLLLTIAHKEPVI